MSQIAPFKTLAEPMLTPEEEVQASAIRHHGRPLTGLSKPELIVLLLQMNQTLGSLAAHLRQLMAEHESRGRGELARQIIETMH